MPEENLNAELVIEESNYDADCRKGFYKILNFDASSNPNSDQEEALNNPLFNNILAHASKTQSVEYLKLSEIGVFNRDLVRNRFCKYYKNGKQKARYILNTTTGVLDIHQFYQNGQTKCICQAKFVKMEAMGMPISEVHIRLVGQLRIFRPDGRLGVSADFGDAESLNGTDVRWIDSLLPRTGETLQVWGRELDVEYRLETFD